MKKELIKEFCDRFNLSEQQWNTFLKEYEDNIPLRELSEKYKVNYNALRYLFYSLGFVNNSKASRIESVLSLQKELARENGQDYVITDEMEKELETVLNKNRQLVRSLTHARDENNSLRKMMRISDRKSNVEEKMLEEFEKALSEITFDKKVFLVSPQLEVKTPKPKRGTVLVFGDEHLGQEDTIESCGNNYNHQIARKRLNYVIDTLLYKYPKQSEILTVFELLDINKGILHNSEFFSEKGITGTMLETVDIFSDVYERLSPYYNNIEVYVTNSNHDRTTQNVSTYMKWDNFGIMLYKMVEKVLKAKGIDNITFTYTKNEYHLVELNKANILVTHGDAFRKYNPTSKSDRANLQSICLGLFDKPYTHAVQGHTHQSLAVSNEYGGYNIVNGSLNGDSEYGVVSGYTSIEPCQTIFFVNDLGKIEDLHFVNLSHIQE